jgi:CRISPR-associated protein Csd2
VTVSESGEARGGKVTEIGRKAIVPYALYRGYGFVNPHFASQTGFSDEDLALFWEALAQMWDFDRSAGRGLISLRGLYVFSHQSRYGNAPAHSLLARVSARRRQGVSLPRAFQDYALVVDDTALPAGVALTRLIG